jgi:hypothetical protein
MKAQAYLSLEERCKAIYEEFDFVIKPYQLKQVLNNRKRLWRKKVKNKTCMRPHLHSHNANEKAKLKDAIELAHRHDLKTYYLDEASFTSKAYAK